MPEATRYAAQPTVVVHRAKKWLRQTETWIFRQVADLPDDIESHVVCDELENLDQFPFPRLHARQTLPRWRKGLHRVARSMNAAFASHLGSVILTTGARVLHTHFGNDAYRAIPTAEALGIPHVVTFYGYDVSQLPRSEEWRRRYRELFSHVDRVLCEGPHMRQAVVDLGCPDSIAHVQHLGADLTRLAFSPRSWSAGQPLRVLIAGSFREKKGIPYALAALGELRRRRTNLELSVVVIGAAGDSAEQRDEQAKIQQAWAESGLGERVEFRGYQPHAELISEARRSHIFLSPSVVASNGDTEGGAPVSILEMAATGMPVVSTRHCDIPNVLVGSASRFLAAERDVPGLVACLEQLLDASPEWQALTCATRLDLEQRFDARRQASRLAEHYRELASAPARSARWQGQALSSAARGARRAWRVVSGPTV